jgi:very-short-patch-repair endonuclease
MRKHSAPAEKILWSRLRRRQLHDLYFRRQRPVGKFIVDFYCDEHHLAIELDGDSHFDGEGVAKSRDDDRTRSLHRAGIRVICFDNTSVFENIDAVLASIARECGIDVA